MAITTSKTHLACRCCGKPLRKWTVTVYLAKKMESYHSGSYARWLYPSEWPKSKQDCEKLTNKKIISIKRDRSGMIASFNEWDGESYFEDLFCTNTCAIAFARASAIGGFFRTKAYADAIRKMGNAND